MQYESAHLSCPLCRRQALSNHGERVLSTRLCEACQNMVLVAFRGAKPSVAAPAVVASQGIPTPSDVFSFEPSFAGAPASFEVTPVDLPTCEPELRSPIPFEEPNPVNYFYKDEDLVDNHHIVDSPAFSPNGSSPQPERLFEGFVHSATPVDDDHDQSTVIEQSSKVEAGIVEPNVIEARTDEPSTIVVQPDNSQSNPSLTGWDYSHSEWPVLVAPNRKKPFGKLRAAIVALALLATAAGFYFLIYRPSGQAATDTGTTTKVSTSSSPKGGSSDSVTQTPATAKADKTAPSQPPETVSHDATTTENSAQGQFSLQAAAFPSQEGADEFAERLKRAGVPSYVVPANIARRGRWFRVRVGRFNSAENAQRFAGEAQARARAAGLAVQLIVCQYDQP